jgi:hypothetical protein
MPGILFAPRRDVNASPELDGIDGMSVGLITNGR